MTTITTTEAATQARVTVATIRNWCTRGVITATKHAGRWLIDTASLTYRINLPALLRPARKTITLTTEAMLAIGGRRWQKNGMDRVYINDWAQFAGLDIAYYGTGNVSGATLGGRGIANGRVAGLLSKIEKVWFDAADGRLWIRHYDADLVDVRYLDGERNIIDLVARLRAGINAAVAAL
ncbi:helix-turn-helix domain-containing protein [Kitasatospora camelliae]|uniref:Helix-turn-helix domain-containing protein n=1 Tax=Kitasatospora camelliae TaxID=3156397 RepID=A0AAU8K6S0_9ACTN